MTASADKPSGEDPAATGAVAVGLGRRVEFRLFQAAVLGMRFLPHSLSVAIGTGLGDLAYRVARGRRRVTLENLRHALPEVSEAERRLIARESFRVGFGVICEAISLTRTSAAEIKRRVPVRGVEHLLRAEERGNGVLLFSAHLGNWEMVNHGIMNTRERFHTLVRGSDNPLIDDWIRVHRETSGTATIDRRGGARQILKLLAAGETVGWFSDQRVLHREGVLVPFFGRPASTSPLMAKLSLRTGAPAVPTFVEGSPGAEWVMSYQEPVFPEDWQGGEDAIVALTARYMQITESEIRRRPGQWPWMHNRWR